MWISASNTNDFPNRVSATRLQSCYTVHERMRYCPWYPNDRDLHPSVEKSRVDIHWSTISPSLQGSNIDYPYKGLDQVAINVR